MAKKNQIKGSCLALAVLAGVIFQGCSLQSKLSERPVNYKFLDYKGAIRKTLTPEQAQSFLDNWFFYDSTENSETSIGESFKVNYKKKKGNCLDYAVCAAALLSDNQYQPSILCMAEENRGHALFVYKKDGKLGALGNTPLEAKYSTVEDLVKAMKSTYRLHYSNYAIVNLDNLFPNHSWIDGDINAQPKIISKLKSSCSEVKE